jgi:putative MATE family efflux protein
VSDQSDAAPFFPTFIRLFVPAVIQSLFFNLIGVVDVFLVGQLGDASIAAVGLAGQLFFLLNLTLFGISAGAAMFAAQYWGAGDRSNLHRVQGLCLGIATSVSALFAAAALLFPEALMRIYTSDPEVITLGISYLRIISIGYVFSAVTVTYAAAVRSTGNTRLPMLVTVVMLSLNMALNYCLIFGKFGLPVLGIRGSAVGNVICRVLEAVTLVGLVYFLRGPAAASLRALFDLRWAFVKRHARLIGVVFLNEFGWALGVNLYNAMFAHLGTQAYAAYSIASSISGLGMFFAFGTFTTASILVGHQVGAGNLDQAYRTGGRLILIGLVGTFFSGMALLVARVPLLQLYQVSPDARADASAILVLVGAFMWLRSLDGIFVVGILRAGGDSTYAALLDVGAIWLAGIPMVALGIYVFHLPVQLVWCGTLFESLAKAILGFRRYRSRRWQTNLARQAPLPPMVENQASTMPL